MSIYALWLQGLLKWLKSSLDDVEDSFSGVKKNPDAASIPNRDDGRMYGILDDTFVTRNTDGSLVAKTKGNNIFVQSDGSFKITVRKTGQVILEKPGKK